jgi:Flp pilus assembly protein TadD
MAALAFEELGELDQALARVQKAIEFQPSRAEYSVSLARLQAKLGNESAAITAAEHALRLEPGSAEIHATLAAVYHLWRDDLAEAAARQAVELDASLPLAQANLGSALWGLGRLEEAERHAREAVRLLPSQLTFQANLAIILKDAGRFDEARSLYRALAAQAPDHPVICLNLGTLAFECDADLSAARRWYAKASAQLKDPRITLSEAIVDLLEGSYEDGWNRYEARKQVGTHRYHHSLYSAFEAWDGRPFHGGRLLVYAEQGLGDEIMFASVLPDLARRIPGIVLACEPRLEKLLARSFPGIAFRPTPRDKAPVVSGGVERTIAMGSLGMHFRRHVTDFPRQASFLVPDEEKTARWRERLRELGPARKIGISWRGGVQGTGRARRSLSLGQLQGLMETPGTNWISLQYGDCAGEVAAFTAATGVPLHAFAGVTDDMDELASLMQALDLVISVCNTTVHVAGAIGKEVLVMAPFVPEWRYGISGERMIWYPSPRVFRQPAYGNWGGVVARVAEELAARLAARGAANVVDQ